MGIFDVIGKPIKAGVKLAARKASDNSYNKQKKEIHQTTFKKVGHKINFAKKKGKKIDAKGIYENIHNKKMTKLEQKNTRRNKFIDEF